ncbi:Sec-independent protein translocase subunit TatA [Streptomyces sp. NPDC000851]
MFGKFGAPEILLVLVVVILLFGAKRLPDMARSLGQSMRILKSETKAMRTRDNESSVHGPAPAQADFAGQLTPPHDLDATPASQEATAGAAHAQDAVVR